MILQLASASNCGNRHNSTSFPFGIHLFKSFTRMIQCLALWLITLFGEVTGAGVSSSVTRRWHCLVESSVGTFRCIACQLCSFWCPVDCLFIFKTGNFTIRNQLSGSWIVDRKRCIYCGNCESVCPVVAINLVGSFPLHQRNLIEALA